MANEARITVSTYIRKVSGSITLIDHNRSRTFQATVEGTKGPAVGAITVTPYGTDVSFSELTTPGICQLTNQSATDTVEYGVYDPEADRYLPFGEIQPGESYLVRLSRNFGWETLGSGTGTGTIGMSTNMLRIRSLGEECNVLVEAFEK
jgi:hypothetical protein